MKSFFKKYFIAGILVLVPVVFTFWVLKTLIVWLDGLIFTFLPYEWRPEQLFGFDIPGAGLILTIIIILVSGILTRLYVGKKLIALGDAIFARLPFGRAIYQATKQVLHTTLSDAGQKQKRVVLVEFPKKGSYALGFLTGDWTGAVSPTESEKEVLVFVPTAPNPTSGFLLIIAQESIIPTNLTTEEASKLLISGGFLAKKAETV